MPRGERSETGASDPDTLVASDTEATSAVPTAGTLSTLRLAFTSGGGGGEGWSHGSEEELREQYGPCWPQGSGVPLNAD